MIPMVINRVLSFIVMHGLNSLKMKVTTLRNLHFTEIEIMKLKLSVSRRRF